MMAPAAPTQPPIPPAAIIPALGANASEQTSR
jgi:hypothetical protein